MNINQSSRGDKVKFAEVIDTKPGLNSRDLKKQQESTYSVADFNYDLNQTYSVSTLEPDHDLNRVTLRQGDLIINLQDLKMAIVSKKNDGKIFSQRFLRVLPKVNANIDIYYLLFLFNESTTIQKQIHSMLEGTIWKLLKVNNVLNIDVQLPKMEMQKKIGSYFRLINEYENLTQKKLNDLNKIGMELLNKLNQNL